MKDTKEIAKVEPTISQRFTSMVVREFSSQVGTLEMSPYQQKLAQHMFVAIDTQLKSLEAKRIERGGKGIEITWSNIDMNKLAIDAVHRVELGLDALIPNHIHPIPYFMKATGKYALDLRIGYAGKDCYRRAMADDPSVTVRYRLAYATDDFEPIFKDADNPVENVRHKVTNAFDRGEVIGGYGYIMYNDEKKNELVLITKSDFDKSKKAAQSNTFWDGHPEQMMFKTVVHRTTEKIPIDPMKVNASFLHVEIDDVANGSERIIAEKANQETVGIDTGEAVDAEFEVNEPKYDQQEDTKENQRRTATEIALEAARKEAAIRGKQPPAPDDLEWG